MKRILLLSFFIASCSAPQKTTDATKTADSQIKGSSAVTTLAAPKFASMKKPTKSELYQGARVPEKREYPLSQKIKPCDDFYNYVCSEVNNNFKLPDDRSRHSFAFSDPSERLLTAKINYLKFLSQKNKGLSQRQEMLKNTFESCMDRPARADEEKQKAQQLVQSLETVKDRAALIALLAKRLMDSEESFVAFSPEVANLDNPEFSDVAIDNSDIELQAGHFRLPDKSYYTKADIVGELKKLYVQFFNELKLPNAEARAQALINFETQFSKALPERDQVRTRWPDKRYYISREELPKKYPHLKYEALLTKVPSKTKIRDLVPEASDFLNKSLEVENLQTLKDAVLVSSFFGKMDAAYPEFYQARFDFRKKYLGGSKVRRPLDEECALWVDNSERFGFDLSAELLPILFSNDVQAKVDRVGQKIREMKIKELHANTWLSPEGKAGAIEKMSKMKLMLFKPKSEKDWRFAPRLAYHPKTYLENSHKLGLAQQNKALKELSEKRNRNRWWMTPTTVNAYYTAEDNTFVLPASILQPPFFDPKAPEYMNVASVGSVFGHEMGHGVDDVGASFDAKGAARQWMSFKDIAEFHKRADDKLVKLFDTIKVQGYTHNGRLTLGENIGDSVGIRTAYNVVFDTDHKLAADELLAMKKNFFAQYARNWCYVALPKAVESQMKTDPHALGEGRVNGQVVHLDGFYESYSCKKGDKMYVAPEERVKIW